MLGLVRFIDSVIYERSFLWQYDPVDRSSNMRYVYRGHQKLIIMNYVYIVYYDNGAQYAEDSQFHVDSVFANEADPNAYAEESNRVLHESEEEDYMGWNPSYLVQKTVLN